MILSMAAIGIGIIGWVLPANEIPIVWKNMPSTNTEFLGQTNNRVQVASGTASFNIRLYVSCIAKGVTNSYLHPEWSTNTLTWTAVYKASVNLSSCPGSLLSSNVPSTSSTGNSLFWRIVGN